MMFIKKKQIEEENEHIFRTPNYRMIYTVSN